LNKKIFELLDLLPELPGVYEFYDKAGEIIYIGKAKNISKRVNSYFKRELENRKLKILVEKVKDIKYIVVDSEQDAYLLENNLIKKYQPRYNVLLKDGKSYPWICIKNERFPRVMWTRNFVRDGSDYYGPYPSTKMRDSLLELIYNLYPLRKCSYVLSDDNIKKGKFKLCLEYHIDNCLGPCCGLQSEEDYNNNIVLIKKILRGNINSVKEDLKRLMNEYSSCLEFEKAAIMKSRIELLENYQSKSSIVSSTIRDLDVFGIYSDDNIAFINYFMIVNGAIVRSLWFKIKKKMNERDEELLMMAISEVNERYYGDNKCEEVVLPFDVDGLSYYKTVTVPVSGEKSKLLSLANRNAKNNYLEYYNKISGRKKKVNELLLEMKMTLGLKMLPVHIECFDNSNLNGQFGVSSLVVFKDGRPSKRDYRHYNIKGVTGIDDYASMEEVVRRRYKRLLEEGGDLPQVILLDGGKGQLNSAYRVIEELGLVGKVELISIAKRYEDIYKYGEREPLYINKKSETLRLLKYIRDEAHRFAISHHRKRRIRETIKSSLTDIKGIGAKTSEKLLGYFGSIDNLRMASEEDIIKLVGKSKAKKLKEILK